jgi:hypothetical protein
MEGDGRGRRWLKGCAIGCGLLVLLGGVACWVTISMVGRLFEGLHRAEESFAALEDELGGVDAYTPPPDGGIAPERLNVFLEVRQACRPDREELEKAIADFPAEELSGESAGGFEKLRRGVGAVSRILDGLGRYLTSRNQALREARMGLGEYTYLYGIAYHSWLGHRPAEGPVIVLDGREVSVLEHTDSPLSPRAVQRRYRRHLLSMLRRQLAAAETGQLEASDWREKLAEEIHRVEDDPGRVAWQDGLPETIAASLEPFREELEAAYSRTTNPAELPFAEGERGFGGP